MDRRPIQRNAVGNDMNIDEPDSDVKVICEIGGIFERRPGK
jgi:hypothetical protein